MAKWLERQSHNLEVLSLNPPGAKAFFTSSINGRVSLIRFLKRGIFAIFLFPILILAVLPEAKQAYYTPNEDLKNLLKCVDIDILAIKEQCLVSKGKLRCVCVFIF